jgi:hypothetical protein
VLVRIRTLTAGVIDGVRLGRLHPGFVYDLHTSLATYLIGSGAAAEMSGTGSRVIIQPPEAFDLLERMTTGGVLIVPSD